MKTSQKQMAGIAVEDMQPKAKKQYINYIESLRTQSTYLGDLGWMYDDLEKQAKLIVKNYLYKEQKGRCAICAKKLSEDEGILDHNHFTGSVRGILCNKCNLGIGLFEDNPEYLIVAANYVNEKKDVYSKAI